MNLKTLALILKGLRVSGSWSQCMRKNQRGLSMNPRVLPASWRQNNRGKALPTRCRQHFGGAVSAQIVVHPAVFPARRSRNHLRALIGVETLDQPSA